MVCFFIVIFLIVLIQIDIRERKIPSEAIVILFLSGSFYFLSLIINDPSQKINIVYVLLPFLVLYFLYWLRVLGAGDIKLLCTLGFFLQEKIILCIVYAFCFNAVLAIGKLWKERSVIERFRYFFSYVDECVQAKKITEYFPDFKSAQKEGIPFSVGIGAAYAMIMIGNVVAV